MSKARYSKARYNRYIKAAKLVAEEQTIIGYFTGNFYKAYFGVCRALSAAKQRKREVYALFHPPGSPTYWWGECNVENSLPRSLALLLMAEMSKEKWFKNL